MTDYIQRLLHVTSDENFNLRIRRDSVLEDTLLSINRTAFSPYKTIVVCMLLARFHDSIFSCTNITTHSNLNIISLILLVWVSVQVSKGFSPSYRKLMYGKTTFF